MEHPEQAFSLWLRRKLEGHVVRVENTIGAGIPDINWCHPRFGEMWIETKVGKYGSILLEKEQYAWGMRRAKCGGRVLVVALLPKGVLRHEGAYVVIHAFPLCITPVGKYLAITSREDRGVLKSEFHCGLLA